MSTRPRIEFNSDSICNACQWKEEKKILNWSVREKELVRILEDYSFNNSFDCVVPVSGGKDGSYIAHTLRTRYKKNPLCITVNPHLATSLGQENLKNFAKSGFDLIEINPHYETLRQLNLIGFRELGFPYYGWLIAIQTAVIRLAVSMNIPLIFYGEDGEVEYGGSTETKNNPIIDIPYQKKVWFEGGAEKIINLLPEELKKYSYMFEYPSDEDLKKAKTFITTWSYYENWDSYRNYVTAAKYCGLREKEEGNQGTFTNFSQNDSLLYPLHTYLMYVKLGFGRATQDAGIEIRRGAMTREQGLRLVSLYDGLYPAELEESYLNYYQMSKEEFHKIILKHTNRDLFEVSLDPFSIKPKFNPG
ncbi:N-acetyl sugar amidotransferase [Prochlorococcus sp. MIT 1304]